MSKAYKRDIILAVAVKVILISALIFWCKSQIKPKVTRYKHLNVETQISYCPK